MKQTTHTRREGGVNGECKKCNDNLKSSTKIPQYLKNQLPNSYQPTQKHPEPQKSQKKSKIYHIYSHKPVYFKQRYTLQ